jgi:TetR/AcrR family transcriptional regulator
VLDILTDSAKIVSMPVAAAETASPTAPQAASASASEKVDRILDAAYACFLRTGFRKTTMDDIATAAGMSRPAVYQYVRNKHDAYRRLATRIFDGAMAQAHEAVAAGGTLAQRLDRVLAIRLVVAQRLLRDSPYAAELVGHGSRVAADLSQAFISDLTDLVTSTIVAAADEADLVLSPENAREIAELALALTRGLEVDLADPARPRERLRNGVALLVAGLAATATPARTPATAP